jgi:Rrf2 family protein
MYSKTRSFARLTVFTLSPCYLVFLTLAAHSSAALQRCAEQILGFCEEVLYASIATRITSGERMPLLPHKTILVVGAVVDIALHSGEGAVPARDVADRLHLSPRHLEVFLQALVREGILAGVRGARGGYILGKARQAISVYDISEAVKTVETEEPDKELPSLLSMVVLPTLAQAEEYLKSNLKRITVEDLVRAASLQMLANYRPAAIAR